MFGLGLSKLGRVGRIGLDARAAAIFRRLGTNATIIMPGLSGPISGLTLANYQDSAATTQAAVDSPLGKMLNANGGAIYASQATAGNRPTLRRGLVNLLTYSNTFTNAAWTKTVNGSASAPIVTPNQSDPFGGNNATRLQLVRSGGSFSDYSGVQQAVTAPNAPNTFAIWVKSNTGSNQTFAWGDSTSTYTSSVATTAWQLFVVNNTSTNPGLVVITRGSGFAASDLSLDLLVYAGFVTQGTLTAAQILAAGGIPLTTTAAASSTQGNWSESYNGTSNYLSLSAPIFQMTGDWCVVAGARPDKASAQCVFSNAAGGASEALPEVGFDSSGHAYLNIVGGGTTVTLASSATYVGTAAVVSARKVGSTVVLRVNGVQAATGSVSGTYTTATNGAIGALPRSTITDYTQGAIYPVVPVKATVSDSDLLTIERWVAARTGPTVGSVVF